MTRYRKKPVEVEAWQVGTEPTPDWVLSSVEIDDDCGLYKLNLEGEIIRYELHGWYIIKEESGYHLVRKEDFEQTYEVVE